MALLAQDKIRKEPSEKAYLTAFGSADPTAQGFRTIGMFNPYRYNFGTQPTFATFLSTGAPSLDVQPFEVTFSNYTIGLEQYVLDSYDEQTYIRMNEDNSCTLSISGEFATWGAVPEFETGNETTIRFKRGEDGDAPNEISLWYWNLAGTALVRHSDAPKVFTSEVMFKVDTVSTPEGAQLVYHNQGTGTGATAGSVDMNWRGFVDGDPNGESWMQWKSRRHTFEANFRAFWGNTDTTGQNQNTHFSVRRQGPNTVQVSMRLRNDGSTITDVDWEFDVVDYDLAEGQEHVWKLERTLTEVILTIDGAVVTNRTTNNFSGSDGRINTFWHAPSHSPSGTLDGEIYDVEIKSSVGHFKIPMSSGTNTLPVTRDVYDGNGDVAFTNITIAPYSNSNWRSLRQPFTGEIYELFLGPLHWGMKDYQESTLTEDGLLTGIDLEIDAATYNVAHWVDLGNESSIEHILDDLGTGAAFVLKDDNPTLFPVLLADYEEATFKNFDEFGGIIREVYRYPNAETLPVGTLLGGFSLQYDRFWKDTPDVQHLYELNGLDGSIQRPSAFGNINGDFELDVKVGIISDPTLGEDFPILGGNVAPQDENRTMLGFIPVDIGEGQKYQFTFRNQGGYSGGAEYTVPCNLDQGNYHIIFTYNNSSGTGGLKVIDLDASDENLVSNGNATNGGTDWALNNVSYTLDTSDRRFVLGTTNIAAIFCGINQQGLNDVLVEAGKTYRVAFDYDSMGADVVIMRMQVYLSTVGVGGGTTFHTQTTTLGANEGGTHEAFWTPTVAELGGTSALVYVSPTDNRSASADASAFTTSYDNIVLQDTTVLYEDAGFNCGGQTRGINFVGYCKADHNGTTELRPEAYARGTISDLVLTNNGNPFINLGIHDNSNVIEDTVGVDWVVDAYDENNWYIADLSHQPANQFESFFLESEVIAGNEVRIWLRKDSGDEFIDTVGFDSTQNVELVAAFSSRQAGNALLLNVGGYTITSNDWQYSGLDVIQSGFGNWAGDAATVGVVKHVKLLQRITFEDSGVVNLTREDFISNRIIATTGVRLLELICPPNETLPAGATVTWECESPARVIVRRAREETAVLVNFTTAQLYTDSSRGSVFCGNVPAVEGYTAYFANSIEAGSVTLT